MVWQLEVMEATKVELKTQLQTSKPRKPPQKVPVGFLVKKGSKDRN